MYKQVNLSDGNKSSKASTWLVACLSAFVLSFLPNIGFAIDLPKPPLDPGELFRNLQINFQFGDGNAGGISDALCTVVQWFDQGGIGAGIASLAVIFMGIAAFFGKVNWGMAITTTVGIFAIFGSDEIISAIVPGGFGCGFF